MCNEREECNHFGDGELRFNDQSVIAASAMVSEVLGHVNDPFLAHRIELVKALQGIQIGGLKVSVAPRSIQCTRSKLASGDSLSVSLCLMALLMDTNRTESLPRRSGAAALRYCTVNRIV